MAILMAGFTAAAALGVGGWFVHTRQNWIPGTPHDYIPNVERGFKYGVWVPAPGYM